MTVFQVSFYKKSAGGVIGFQSTDNISAVDGFFQSRATPDLQGQLLVSVEQCSHVVCEPYNPESKGDAS
ncbi:hypothetical protein [Klebsiella variicola]|nr:hypothetical protein [Klebsiella variicola]